MTLYIVFLQTVKKVESYEQINIQSIILSEAQCAKEERTVWISNSFQGLEERRRAEKYESGTGCIRPKNTDRTCTAG